MCLRVFSTQTEHDTQLWGSDGWDWSLRMKDQLLEAHDPRYAATDDPEEADLIVFWEPHQDAQAVWAPRLRAHPLVHQYPNKAFVVSVEDAPLGFLPGLYTSLPARLHHPKRHRTWIYYRLQNPYLHARRDERQDVAPRNLASFTGANSDEVRAALFDRKDGLARHRIFLEATRRGRFAVNPHDPRLRESQIAYIDAMLDAKFSLCPRGNGAGSYRVQESLAVGRPPVIISDEWVPVADLDWNRFAVFVEEKNLRHLPAILCEREPHWAEMAQKARETYEAWFRLDTFAVNALRHITAIHRTRTHDERSFIARWDDMIAARQD
ncbi:MAG TPA: exostosin family protein [Thermoanaerobaculia bacterium]|nr:exostosin family protein [Thermoanaerobaculia bacterium]